MAKPKTTRVGDRDIVVHEPDWEKIMAVLGSPSQSATFVDNTNWVNPSQSMQFQAMDGAWDQTAAQKGMGMRRVAADIGKTNGPIDIPSGFVFVCECGHARRVVDSEHAFTCERPNAKGAGGCGILWQKDAYLDEEDLNVTSGLPIAKARLEERETPNKRKYLMPIIKGYKLADWNYMNKVAREKMSEEQLVAIDGAAQRDRDMIRDGKISVTEPSEVKE
jgi:hypothetical protein